MISVKVINMSEDGALLTGSVSRSVKSFTLHLPEVRMILPCQVVAAENGEIHAAFNIPEENRAKLATILQRLARDSVSYETIAA